jgi:hypothetical protein
VEDLGTEVDIAKETVAAFITDFAEGLDRKQTIWMEGATTSLEDIHHADRPHPFGILRGEDEQ